MARPRPKPTLWRRDQLIMPLLPLAYVERACAHIRCGWLSKVSSLDVKIALGKHQHADMTSAAKLERAYGAMTRLYGPADRSIPKALRAAMESIDAARDESELLRRIYCEVKPVLAERYAALIARMDPVLDAHVLDILEPAHAATREQIAWANKHVAEAPRKAALAALRKLVAGARPPAGARVRRQQWLWPPHDRVPRCVRVAPLVRVRLGKLAHRLADGPGTRGAIGEFFHHLTGTELATMELYGRCSYEHPTMPEEFHHDYARVIWDEARHAELAMRNAARYGLPFGAMTIDVSSYEANYQFPKCKPGSRKELLWRLVLQGTFQESLIIEGFPLQAKKMRFAGFDDAARVAEVLAEDDVAHVATALKWSRMLCKGDKERVREERELAHVYQYELVMAARRQYVGEDPERAIAETEKLQAYAEAAHARFPFSLTVHVNREARRAIGFTEQEIEQVLDWGYFEP